MCCMRSSPLETRETSIYSVAPEVPVPGTGTSGPTRSDRWSLDPSRSDRCGQADLTVVRDSDPPEVPPELPVRDRK